MLGFQELDSLAEDSMDLDGEEGEDSAEAVDGGAQQDGLLRSQLPTHQPKVSHIYVFTNIKHSHMAKLIWGI